ncbi:MAG: MGMT family [Lasallia pustulata]|uniref:MGMT family n=1 Tax=Lasallia pustulata TaxID=136370 RepID=A0A5M8PSP5_9LECA|nr:MAG: MGMT family [Lasallia pustulata]
MARSDEAEWWFNAVYEAVQEIPHGKVTSYGHIARLLGRPECPRRVGICLKHLPTFSVDVNHHFHGDNVPWQRVINAKGVISQRGPGGASRQAAALRREGVHVGTGTLGELTVDLATFGWFPSRLPSEVAEGDSSDSEQDG